MPQRICKAHSKAGKPCGAFAMRGQLVCYMHGGATPNGRAAGARRVAEQKALKALADIGDVPAFSSVVDVYAELMEVAATAAQWRKILQGRVSELRETGYGSDVMGEQIRADVQLFERSLERSAVIGEKIARLNLEERKQALDERLAGMVARAVQEILEALELDERQLKVAAVIAPKKIRELSQK